MKKLGSIVRGSFLPVKLLICSFYTFWYIISVVMASNNIFVPNEWFIKQDVLFLLTICSIFASPLIFVLYLGSEVDKWERAYLNAVHLITVLFAIGIVILWYYYPDHNRLESLVALLGFSAAWTTYLRDRRLKGTSQITESSTKVELVPQLVRSESQHQIWYV